MKIAKTAPEALELLWSRKTFLKKRNFNEIKTELEKLGYNFTDHNLGMALNNVKFLTKKGKRGEFTYIQKHPYIEEIKNERPKRNK